MNSMPKNKALKYLGAFLIFGPMLGLMLFIFYIIREQAIPMFLIAAAGVGIGNTMKYIIFFGRTVFNSRNLLINTCGWLSVGIICSLLGCYLYGVKFLLWGCAIGLLGILYAIYFKYCRPHPSA